MCFVLTRHHANTVRAMPYYIYVFLVTVQLDAQIPFNVFIYLFIYSSLHVSSMTCSKHVMNYK